MEWTFLKKPTDRPYGDGRHSFSYPSFFSEPSEHSQARTEATRSAASLMVFPFSSFTAKHSHDRLWRSLTTALLACFSGSLGTVHHGHVSLAHSACPISGSELCYIQAHFRFPLYGYISGGMGEVGYVVRQFFLCLPSSWVPDI